MNEPQYNPRKSVRESLSMLASREEQLAYERNVPHVDITVELVCDWFDDTYHPDESWNGFFTVDELEALRKFNVIYENLYRKLPDSNGTVKTWLSNPVWQEIMAAASTALAAVSA